MSKPSEQIIDDLMSLAFHARHGSGTNEKVSAAIDYIRTVEQKTVEDIIVMIENCYAATSQRHKLMIAISDKFGLKDTKG